jgi:chromate transporter
VHRLRWLSGEDYSALVALCQVLPGPSSSQVGFLIGLHRAGWPGALAAWLGFTLPSALLLYGCAVLSAHAQGPIALAVLHGLKLAAVAVVAQALWSMAHRLCPDRATAALALAAAAVLLLFGGAATQLAALAGGAAGGILLCRRTGAVSGVSAAAPLSVPRPLAWAAAALFALLLLALPLLASLFPHGYVALAEVFYRAGALVFGGGHVVLPLLRDALVPAGWISDDGFLAGYGLAQAAPGPLFTVAAYLGAANAWTHSPALATAVAVVFIFLPGLLLAVAGAALWGSLARHAAAPAALAGVNAAVVGILGAALYDPVWITAVRGAGDAVIAGGALLLLMSGKAPPLVIVLLCAACSVIRVPSA